MGRSGPEHHGKTAGPKPPAFEVTQPGAQPGAAVEGDKVCPFCAETIKAAAIFCRHCGRNLDSAPPASPSAAVLTPEKTSKTYVIVATLSIMLIVLFAMAQYGNTPDVKARGDARRAIEYCWDQQKRKSIDPGSARFIAGACEKMESDFRASFNANP